MYVWISTVRKGIEYHEQPDDGTGLTGCGRSTRTGESVDRDTIVTEKEAKPCPRCYPPGPR